MNSWLFTTSKMLRVLLLANLGLITRLSMHRYETVKISSVLDLVTRDLRFKNINLDISYVRALAHYASNKFCSKRITEISGSHNFAQDLFDKELVPDGIPIIHKLSNLKKLTVFIKVGAYDYSTIALHFHGELRFNIIDSYIIDEHQEIFQFDHENKWVRSFDIDATLTSNKSVVYCLSKGIFPRDLLIIKI
jgi:hypothetical protein